MRRMVFGAFQHPFRDPRAVRKLLLGAALSLLPIMNLLAFGYTLRLLEQVLQGEEEGLPEWTAFADLFVRGVKVFVVSSVYVAVPLLLQEAGANLFLVSLVALLSGALEPMAQVCLARSGRIWPALALPKLWTEIMLVLRGYLVALAVWYGVFLFIAVALSGIGAPLLWVLGSFIGFYMYLFFAALFGRACSRSRLVRYLPS